jgi:hypothetical protein
MGSKQKRVVYTMDFRLYMRNYVKECDKEAANNCVGLPFQESYILIEEFVFYYAALLFSKYR